MTKQTNTIGIIALILALGALAVGLWQPKRTPVLSPPSSILTDVVKSTHIRAAYIVYPPTVSVESDPSAPSGFLIDVMDTIAQRAGLSVTYQPTTFADMKLALQSGRYDVVVAGVFVNIPRAREMQFTIPIMFWRGVEGVIRTSDASKYSELSALNNPTVRIAVTAGTAEYDFVKQNFAKAQILPQPNSDISLTLATVTAGRADVAFADAITVGKFVAVNSDVTPLLSGEQFNTYATAFAVPNGDFEWLQFLNESLLSLQVDGTIKELSDKYHGADFWMLPAKPWQ